MSVWTGSMTTMCHCQTIHCGCVRPCRLLSDLLVSFVLWMSSQLPAKLRSTQLSKETPSMHPAMFIFVHLEYFCATGQQWLTGFLRKWSSLEKLREQMNWHLLSLHPQALCWKHRINACKCPRGEVPWNGSKLDLKRLGYRLISVPKALTLCLKHTALALTGMVVLLKRWGERLAADLPPAVSSVRGERSGLWWPTHGRSRWGTHSLCDKKERRLSMTWIDSGLELYTAWYRRVAKVIWSNQTASLGQKHQHDIYIY